jgi:hypothetical protein
VAKGASDGSGWRAVAAFLSQFVGVALVVVAMTDVFLRVLYARASTAPVSRRVASGVWAAFRGVAGWFPRHQAVILSLGGPSCIVMQMVVWVGLLLLGFTLIAWPSLGSGIQSERGDTPRDFLTAFYYAGGSMTTIGSGDIRPVAPAFKVLTVIDSLMGMGVITLTVTYVVQLYTALQARNALALTLHHASDGTGNAAVLLARLGAGDDFTRSGSNLASLASQVTAMHEAHHFYPVLIYFRFPGPQYAMPRGALITMDLVALVEAALDPGRHGWLSRSASIRQLHAGGLDVLVKFSGLFLPGGAPDAGTEGGAVTGAWSRRYRAAVEYLRREGIAVNPDPQAGVERYVELRRQWDAHVMALADYLGHPRAEVDPAGTDLPEAARLAR